MSYEPREFLRHILTEADDLVDVSAGLSRAQLEEDPTVHRAVVRSIEIIGEATKRLPTDIREANPDVQWRSMARMRDRLVHEPGLVAVAGSGNDDVAPRTLKSILTQARVERSREDDL